MAFTRNKPAAADLLSTSQGDIKNNFNSSDDTFGIDHYAFSDTTANIGAHKQAQFKETTLGAIPAGLKGVGFETLYASTTTNGGQLFYVQGNNATGVQLTGPFTPNATAFGYTFLAGGLLMQWGFIAATTSSYTPLLFATNNINFPTNCFFVTTQPYSKSTGSPPSSQATVAIQGSSVTNLGFNWAFVSNSSDYRGFYWMAIGN